MNAKAGVAVPAQAAPVSDIGSSLFANVWYLFWQSVSSKLNSILGRIAALEADVVILKADDQTVDQTLTVASTTIFAPTTGAKRLIEIVRQDATGGRAIVWDAAGFSAASVSLGAATLSTLCVFGFVLVGSKYVMTFEGPKDMTP